MCGAIPLTFHAASYSDFAFTYFSEGQARRGTKGTRGLTAGNAERWFPIMCGRTDKWHATHPETSLYSVSLFNNSITYSWDFTFLLGRGWLIV